jgi:murein biosynthesis integral membrane protein MurJ
VSGPARASEVPAESGTSGRRAGAHSGSQRFLLRAAVLVAALTLAGRALGFVRDVLIANFFGASAETDAFLVAWTIPETASPLLVEAAVIYALVPVFVGATEAEGSPRVAVARMLGPVLVALALVTALVAVMADPLVSILAPGLVEDALAARSLRVASLTVLGFGVAGLMIAALRSQEVFGVPATVSILFNLGIIATILLLRNSLGIFSAAIGLAVGAAAMVAVQLPTFVRSIGWPSFGKSSIAYAARVLAPFLPIAAFVLLRHSQVYVERFLASMIEAEAISYLGFAERIAWVPLGLTLAIAVVSFPAIASAVSRGRLPEVRAAFERDLKLVSLVMVPAIAMLVVLADPLVDLLFRHGSFSDADATVTSDVLEIYAWGLLGTAVMAVAVLPVYSRRSHVGLPIISALIGLGVMIAIAVALEPSLGVRALALATAIGSTVMGVDLLRRVRSQVLAFDAGGFVRHLGKVVASGAVAGLLAWIVGRAAPDIPIVQIAVGGGTLMVAYVALARVLGVEHLDVILRPLARWRESDR